jgi:hypothetical protein
LFWQHWYISFGLLFMQPFESCLGEQYFLVVWHVEFANSLYLSWVWRNFTLDLSGGLLYLEWQHLLLLPKARILHMTSPFFLPSLIYISSVVSANEDTLVLQISMFYDRHVPCVVLLSSASQHLALPQVW